MARRSPLFLALASLGSWAPAQAATITVNTNDPAVNPGDGLCSLTEAIQNANGDNESSGGDCVGGNGADTIELPAAQTITLTSALPNLLGDVTIVGNQARIERADTGCSLDGAFSASEFRLLTAKDEGQTVMLSDFSLANGCADGNEGDVLLGGALYAYESHLTLQGMRIENNRARGSGGGVAFLTESGGGSVTIRDSHFVGNQSTNRGGGLRSNAVDSLIEDSAFTGNQAFYGGALFHIRGNPTVTRSSFSGNTATYGGAISFQREGATNQTLTITDSTISGNSAAILGGGIIAYGASGLLQITDSTLVDNVAGVGADHIFTEKGHQTTVSRSLLSGGGASACELAGVQNSSDNLVTAASCSALGTMVTASALQLGPLQDNGGPTLTHALGVGSVAIDAGGSGCGSTDQRGFGRPADGDNDGNPLCDVGSFELGETPAAGPDFVVNATTDVGDGVCGPVVGQCTLREAVQAANSNPDASVITFDPSVFASAQTISLSAGEMLITTPVTVTGPGRDLLTVDAGNTSRHFHISDGSDAAMAAGLSDLTLINGSGGDGGGAILSEESLTLGRVTLQGNQGLIGGAVLASYPGAGAGMDVVIDDVLLTQNSAGLRGGAMYVSLPTGGSLTVRNSQFLDNQASDPGVVARGGAAYFSVFDGVVLVEDSTFSGNEVNAGTSATGGAFTLGGFDSQVTLQRLTVSGNAAGSVNGRGTGGGLVASMDGGSFSLTDSIISGNTAGRGSVGSGMHRFGGGYITLSGVSNAQIARTTISNNVAVGWEGGGLALSTHDGTSLVLDSSTMSGNTAGREAGGLFLIAGESTTTTISNTTISGNSANRNGGGVAVFPTDASAQVSISGVTITNNLADANANGGEYAGGLWLYSVAGSMVSIDGTVIAGNAIGGTSSQTDFTANAEPFAISNSLIGNNDGNGLAEAPIGAPDGDNNLVGGTTHGFIDPVLGVLSDNGGTTFTHRPLGGSPLIDHYSDCLRIDQRGSGRPADGDGNGSVLCDVGAVEVGETPASGPNFVVNATTDIGDGVCGAVPGQCTLREAVMAANSDPDATVITFDPSVFASAQTVMLSQGQMQITAATTITGPGRDLLTVDANGASRHFLIDDANAATSAAVSISDISLLNGAALAVSEKGGSIRSHEPLTLTSVVLQGNTAEMAGGAVLAYHGLLASDCIVSGNRARLGGGLRVEEGDTEITGCEFSLNTTQSFGAAFATRAQGTTLRIVDSLFVDNLAGSTSAGAILVQPGLGMAQFERIRVIDNGATTGGRGGGLDVRMNAGDFILIDSEISGNTLGGVGSGRFGGGLYLSMTDHTATITRSTFSGNSTTQEGGGLYLKAFGSGQIRIEDSTISGNSAGSFGGGVGGYARDAASSIEIVRSTITDNVADADNNGIGQGGGIALPYALPNGMFSVTGTVIAGNADSNPSSAPDLLLPAATPFDLTDSLIGDNRGSDLMEAPVGSPDADNNLIGGPTNGVIDPALGILSDNGGPSFTHRPVDGSPLIDHYAGCAGIDQIGQPRGLDGDGMFGDDCDIGAVEFTSSLFHDGFEDGPIVKRFEARQATIERDDVLDRLPINGRAQIVLRAPGASPEQSLVIVHARRVGDRVELQLNRLERGVWTQGAWRPMTGASARLRW